MELISADFESIEIHEATGSDDDKGGVELSGYIEPDGSTSYIHFVPDWHDLFSIGDRSYYATLFLQKDNPSEMAALGLISMVIKPSVVVSVDPARNPVCLVRSPAPEKFFDSTIIIHRKSSQGNSLEPIYGAIQPGAWCTPLNVKVN